MADTFTWNISNLDRHLADGAVYCSYWTLNAKRTVDGQDEPLTAGCYGSVNFGAPDPDNFIPYEDLTREIVIQWTKDALGEETVAATEAALSKQMDLIENPVDSKGVPW